MNSQSGKRLLLLGAGGHCSSVLDVLMEKNEYTHIGIVTKAGETFADTSFARWVGHDEDLLRLRQEGFTHGFVTVGSLSDTSTRRKLYALLLETGFLVPTIASTTAHVSPSAKLHPGAFIGKGVCINANSTVQQCAIINTGAIVEHDCSVGAFAHISPGAVLCGNVSVGADAHIGANATVIQGLSVGTGSQVGAGSVVTHSIGESVVAYGNPCEVRRSK